MSSGINEWSDFLVLLLILLILDDFLTTKNLSSDSFTLIHSCYYIVLDGRHGIDRRTIHRVSHIEREIIVL